MMSDHSDNGVKLATDIHAGFRQTQDEQAYEALQALSSAEIATLALQAKDTQVYLDLLACLHQRGTQVEFQIAAKFCGSEDAQARKIGADILGQLGWARQTCQQESLAILRQCLRDRDADVIAAAAYALGHRRDPQAITDLVQPIAHPSSSVREALASALSGYDDEQAIAGLIALSADPHENTRNWATFALGSLCETCSENLNAALIARLDEANREIRGEALLGLANRRHPNTLNWLINELNSECINVLILEAAELCFTERDAALLLYPLLLKWKRDEDEQDDYFERCLEQTLAACERVIAD